MSGGHTIHNPDYCLSKAAEQELKSKDMKRSFEERNALKDSAERWFKHALSL